MVRYLTAAFVAVCAAYFAMACGDTAIDPSGTAGSGGASNGGLGTISPGNGGSSSNGGSVQGVAERCAGACCPTVSSCYSNATGNGAPGAACMARITNTKDHIQLRQTWIDILAPAGNTINVVLGVLNRFTQFNEPACNTPKGLSGFMQAIDTDLAAGVSTLGFVKYVTSAGSALSDGLCYVDVGKGVDASNPGFKDVADYAAEKNFDFSLPANQMSPTTGWPDGLPAPMPQPWKIAPTKAKRLDTDFKLPDDRVKLLQRLSPTGDLGMAGFDGVFYYDATTGKSHGWSPLSYQIIYDPPATEGGAATTYFATPIREAEIRFQVNDPNAPNCVGRFLPENLDPRAGCVDPKLYTTKPAWGGIFDTKPGDGDMYVQGYFLITELEQIYARVLQQTLCVSYPTIDKSITDGWATMTEKRCRKSPKWNPQAPDNAGLPMGDWCAATNGPATPTCHDAYLSKSFHALQAFKIKTDHCTAL